MRGTWSAEVVDGSSSSSADGSGVYEPFRYGRGPQLVEYRSIDQAFLRITTTFPDGARSVIVAQEGRRAADGGWWSAVAPGCSPRWWSSTRGALLGDLVRPRRSARRGPGRRFEGRDPVIEFSSRLGATPSAATTTPTSPTTPGTSRRGTATTGQHGRAGSGCSPRSAWVR
ncbi:MAG: hypothetical protein R2713_21945 [Ilumatobacteraceae bacterium]